ncbi:MAG TPA: deoxyribose-phosphate aldolase [Candidatus Sumerlaeota bacterium]|nr:deoxyribose-phosphate aldolase [Candidatus Sumerlaeota bacterium]
MRDSIQTIARIREELAAVIQPEPPALTHPALIPPLDPDSVNRLTPAELARFLDSTLLKPEATLEQIDALCDEARRLHVAAVCVHPTRLAQCIDRLAGTPVRTATVVGFPLGAMTSAAKAFETVLAVEAGADEIDMVLNLGWLRDGDDAAVRDEIRAVVEAARGRIVKVIVESGGLSDEELIRACLLARDAGAHFVKTSTGFLFGGAEAAAVALMRAAVGPLMGVKAAGGVRDAAAARAMLRAGATRIGTSSARVIVDSAPAPAGPS